ncbi:MAG: hypothetical protein AAGH40_02390 [Verrucomicrobiota bacterium]
MTEIKSSYLKAFWKTFTFFFVLGGTTFPFIWYLEGKPVDLAQMLIMGIICGGFLGTFGTIFFTPKRIEWNEEKVIIHCLFPGTGEHTWDELQGYSTFGKKIGTFLIKFRGKQAYQISPFGFEKKEWNEFLNLLTDGFPSKKKTFWLGPIPIK